MKRNSSAKIALAGLISGFLNGLFGSGGGVAAVMFLRPMLKDEKKAHASATLMILVMSAVSFALYAVYGQIEWGRGLMFVPGGIVGALLGVFEKYQSRYSSSGIRGGADYLGGGDVANMSWWAATIVGAASGVLASMGLGGGFILVVYLALCTDIAQRSAQGINLLFFIPIIVIAVVLHIKNKLIDVRLALSCSAVGAAAAVAGFFAAQAVEETALRTAFAVFIVLAGLKDLFAKGVDKE